MASGTIQRPSPDNFNILIQKAILGTTFNITVPAGYRALMFTIDSGSTLCGMWFLWSTAGAEANFKTIAEATGFSLTGGTGKFTVTKTNNTAPTMIFIEFSGKASI